MKDQMKSKVTPLDKELTALKFNTNVAHSKYKCNKARTYGKMAEVFGIKIEDEVLAKKYIGRTDIDKFSKELEDKIKIKYGQPRDEYRDDRLHDDNGADKDITDRRSEGIREDEDSNTKAARTLNALRIYDYNSDRFEDLRLADYIQRIFGKINTTQKLLVERTEDDILSGSNRLVEGSNRYSGVDGNKGSVSDIVNTPKNQDRGGEVDTRSIGQQDREVIGREGGSVIPESSSSNQTAGGQNTIGEITETTHEDQGHILEVLPAINEDNGNNRFEDNRIVNSIYNPRVKSQRVDLLPPEIADQVGCAKKLFDNVWYHNKRGQLLIAPAGSGKTYILGSVISNLLEAGIVERCKSISPWPIFYVTAASIVEQSEEVLKYDFGLDTVNTVQVVNIEFFRTKFGGMLVKRQMVVVNNEAAESFTWVPNLLPALIVWDESQMLAREQAIQTKIACAVADAMNENPNKTKLCYQIDSSATPFSRVVEAKHFVVASGIEFEYRGHKRPVTNTNWTTFARQIASPFDPELYSVEAIKQLANFMEPYIVRIDAINPEHKAYNSVMAMNFKSKEQADYYYNALKRYNEEKARLESDGNLNAAQLRIALLATFTILRKAAEYCKCEQIAEWMNFTYKKGFAPLVVVAFKGTITKVVRILIEEYGWTREEISLIWGGSTETLSKKKKVAKRIMENKEMMEQIMGDLGVSLEDLGVRLEDMEQKTDEQLLFEKVHKLSSQSIDQRHEEKMRFQRQDSKGMLITFKAGGKGLSAHHEHKYPKAKPRRTLLSPVYSEKEMIQGLGRGPRITSASDTYQVMCYFARTIEEDVKERFIMKAKCMQEIIRLDDNWMDILDPKAAKVKPTTQLAEDLEMIDTNPALIGEFVEEGKLELAENVE